MKLGNFHKKKRKIINKIKIGVVSFFFFFRKNSCCLPEDVKNCILIHDNEKIGDLIVLSSLYRELKKRNIKTYVVTGKIGFNFLKYNEIIEGIYVKKGNTLVETLKLIFTLRNTQFDLLIDPFETFPNYLHAVLLSGIKARYTLGFDHWYKKYYCTYNSHDEFLKEHISTRAKEIADFLPSGSDIPYDSSYDIPLPISVENEVRSIIDIDSRPIVVINPFGAKKICKLTLEQVNLIYNTIKNEFNHYRVIFTGHPEDLDKINIGGIEKCQFSEFIYTIALTKHSSFIISVDTALIHIASAYKIPTLALYPKARHDGYDSTLIWAPNNDKAIQLISPSYSVQCISNESVYENIKTLLSEKSSLTR